MTITPVDEKLLKLALEIVEKHMDEPEFSVEDFSRDMYMNCVTLYGKILFGNRQDANRVLSVRFV